MAAPDPCPEPKRLDDLAAGRLAPDAQAELTRHVERCEKCLKALAERVAGTASWSETARQAARAAEPEPALRRVIESLKQHGRADGAGDDASLDFLSPPSQPGHLGRLGKYDVLSVIGRGGMGVVLKAFDPTLHRVVAIKVLAPQLATTGTARKRFKREAVAAAAVCHDHVVTIHEVDEANGLPYLVMQYVAGQSLQDRLDRDGPLELREILRIGFQMASGLAAAHAQGLIHRDVKPANILLENGIQRVKLTDFGLARAIDDASLTQSGLVAGTPQYMAPEQARGDAVDQRADLFSLGSVLYAMCTGRAPFRASTALGVLNRVTQDEPRPIRELNPEIPDWLVDVVQKLHAKNPGQRYQTAADVAEVLGGHLARLQQASWLPAAPAAPRPKADLPGPHLQPASSIPAACPACGAAVRVPEHLVGQRVACPQCGQVLLAEEPSAEVRPVAANKWCRRRRGPRGGCLKAGLVLIFLLMLGCCLVGYIRWEEAAAPAHAVVSVTDARSLPPPIQTAGLREHLRWFPQRATLFGVLDLQGVIPLATPGARGNTPDSQLLPPNLQNRLGPERIGTARLDGASFAVLSGKSKAESHYIVRLHGLMDPERLTAYTFREAPGAVAIEQQPDAQGEPVVLLSSPKLPFVVALVGRTDVLFVGALSGKPAKEANQAVVQEVLYARSGHADNLQQGMGALTNNVPDAFGVVAGLVPPELQEARPADRNAMPWPARVLVSCRDGDGVELRGSLVFTPPEQGQAFVTAFERWKGQVRRRADEGPKPGQPAGPTIGELARILDGIRLRPGDGGQVDVGGSFSAERISGLWELF